MGFPAEASKLFKYRVRHPIRSFRHESGQRIASILPIGAVLHRASGNAPNGFADVAHGEHFYSVSEPDLYQKCEHLPPEEHEETRP